MKKSQKDKIYEIVREILGDKYSDEQPMREFFVSKKGSRTRDYGGYTQNMKLALEKFLDAYEKNEISIEPKYVNPRYLKNLFINWLEKDPRLNGKGGIKDKIRKNIDLNSSDKIVKGILSNETLDELFKHFKIANDAEVLQMIKLEIVKLILKKACSYDN